MDGVNEPVRARHHHGESPGQTVAERYGAVRAALESKDKDRAPLDLQIAAHALSVGAILVTNDRAFKHATGLHLEDWTR